jgi:hypothetical protein
VDHDPPARHHDGRDSAANDELERLAAGYSLTSEIGAEAMARQILGRALTPQGVQQFMETPNPLLPGGVSPLRALDDHPAAVVREALALATDRFRLGEDLAHYGSHKAGELGLRRWVGLGAVAGSPHRLDAVVVILDPARPDDDAAAVDA